jgi:cytochrome c oxidase subunit II
MTDQPHFTTRRGFIAAAGFGGTALYGLWVGYGAAPSPLALFGATHADTAASGAGHAAHSASGHEALTPEAFEARVQAFVARFGESDGSVRPRADGAANDAVPDAAQHDPHAGHAPPARASHGDHGAHGAAAHAPHSAQDERPHADHGALGVAAHGSHSGSDAHPRGGHGDHGAAAHAPRSIPDAHPHDTVDPIDVWLHAGRFFFMPWHLRLVTHQPYRFRMMATDVSHGASIQFGRGGRMIRLRPGQLVETDITLHQPGDYLIYCTVYCGAAHDAMQARLSVTEGGAA